MMVFILWLKRLEVFCCLSLLVHLKVKLQFYSRMPAKVKLWNNAMYLFIDFFFMPVCVCSLERMLFFSFFFFYSLQHVEARDKREADVWWHPTKSIHSERKTTGDVVMTHFYIISSKWTVSLSVCLSHIYAAYLYIYIHKKKKKTASPLRQERLDDVEETPLMWIIKKKRNEAPWTLQGWLSSWSWCGWFSRIGLSSLVWITAAFMTAAAQTTVSIRLKENINNNHLKTAKINGSMFHIFVRPSTFRFTVMHSKHNLFRGESF